MKYQLKDFKNIFNELYKYIKNKKIIGFGECTHWSSIIIKFRIQFFKYLYKKYKYRYFFIETNIYNISIIDLYINNIIEKPSKIYLYLMHPFRDKYTLQFIEWCKNKNKNKNKNDRIHIIGWDCQSNYNGDIIILRKKFKKYIKLFFKNLNIIKINNYYDKISNIKYTNNNYCNIRDKYSYNIFNEIYKNISNNDKIFLIGHNLHLLKTKYNNYDKVKYVRFGYYINNKYDYYSIGTDIISGKIISNYNNKKINWNGLNILKRKNKQINKIEIIKPNNNTIICSTESSKQKLININNEFDLIISFINDLPWTYKLNINKMKFV